MSTTIFLLPGDSIHPRQFRFRVLIDSLKLSRQKSFDDCHLRVGIFSGIEVAPGKLL
jgi:hypothetical protein